MKTIFKIMAVFMIAFPMILLFNFWETTDLPGRLMMLIMALLGTLASYQYNKLSKR